MASSSVTASATLTGSPRRVTKPPSCSCSFTNADAAPSPTACSTHHHGQNSNPPPELKRLTAKLTDPSNRLPTSALPDDVREKFSDQKLKNLNPRRAPPPYQSPLATYESWQYLLY